MAKVTADLLAKEEARRQAKVETERKAKEKAQALKEMTSAEYDASLDAQLV